MIIDEADYLEHFGVKGMRWGVRRRPSQLSPNKTDTDITRDVKSDYNNLSNGQFLAKYATTKRTYAKRVAKYGDPYRHAINKQTKTAAGLTPNQAALAVYGAVAAAVILNNARLKYKDSGRIEARQSKNVPFKVNPKLRGKKSVEQLNKDVVRHINPDYGAVGTKMNCRRATMAYEMRRRGYDVKATKSKFATGQTIKGIRKVSNVENKEKFESLWGAKRVSTPREFGNMTAQKKAETVFSSLSQHPNGARGEIGSSWIMGGGHSQAWEIVNNKPVIFDTQNGRTYSSAKQYSEFTATIGEAAHTRLDNRPINDELVRRWVTNA